MIYLQFPVLYLIESFKILTRKSDYNCICEGKKNIGKKKGGVCLDIKLTDIKKIYKSRGITIN